MRSASSGVTSSVTTVAGDRLAVCPRLLLIEPGSCGQHLHVAHDGPGDRLLSVAAPPTITRTSTRVPGMTKPATPTTSLVFTEIARMPSGIVGGSPPPEPSGASLDSVSGSFSATSTMAPRLSDVVDLGERARDGVPLRPGHQLHVILGDDRAHRDRPRGDHGLQAGHLDLADRDGRHDAVDDEARRACGAERDGQNERETRITIHFSLLQ